MRFKAEWMDTANCVLKEEGRTQSPGIPRASDPDRAVGEGPQVRAFLSLSFPSGLIPSP